MTTQLAGAKVPCSCSRLPNRIDLDGCNTCDTTDEGESAMVIAAVVATHVTLWSTYSQPRYGCRVLSGLPIFH